MKIATFDIGTTAVKGVLVSEEGKEILSASVNIETHFDGERKEQEPEDWYRAFCEISAGFFRSCGAAEIGAVIMSGQMQDVIPVGKDARALGRAILYSDGRAEQEAAELIEKLGADRLCEITGNRCDGSLSFPKILWLKRHQPELFRKTEKFLISSKDYVILRLCGRACGDVTACATAGAMDIHKKQWSTEILEADGISAALLPEILYAEETAGVVTEAAARETGYMPGTKVYVGTGDAGATTLASGIVNPGEYNINLGTSGWVASVSEETFQSEGGVFNLAAMPKGRYINVVPFLNAGNVHKWVSELFSGQREVANVKEGPDYAHISRLLQRSRCGSGNVLFLPYIAGERFPVLDSCTRGCFYGITPETKPEDMIRSALEGVAFSIRQGIEGIGVSPRKVSVIGGGARERLWNQILADVLKTPLSVFRNAEMLPALALSSAVLLGEGKISDYTAFTDRLQRPEFCDIYQPNPKNGEVYDRIYVRYRKLYPAVKGI